MNQVQVNQQDLISQVYELLSQNGNLSKWRINRDRNTITLQWVSHVDSENVDIRVVFHDNNVVEITFLQAAPYENETMGVITRVFSDGAIEYVKEMPARGYKITVDLTKKPLWLEPEFMAYIIAEIVDLMIRVYYVD